MSIYLQQSSNKLHILKRRVNSENSSLRNHLLSIERDSEIVLQVREFFKNWILFANLRNGKWYSDKFEGHCYFKSTDGHESNWTFSLVRMNLDFARMAAAREGAIVVDSTRKGKLFPDSMTATIPIWCSIINEIIFDRPFPLTPPPWMPPSALSQINLLLSVLIKSISANLREMIKHLLISMTKPFRPVWVVPDEDGVLEWFGEGIDELLEWSGRQGSDESRSENNYDSNNNRSNEFTNDNNSTSNSDSNSLEFTPLILLSCSPLTSDNTHNTYHSWKYIQGAGDDEENWNQGLTSELFWKEKEKILKSDDPYEVEATVLRLLQREQAPSVSEESVNYPDPSPTPKMEPTLSLPSSNPAPSSSFPTSSSSSFSPSSCSLFPIGKSGIRIGVKSHFNDQITNKAESRFELVFTGDHYDCCDSFDKVMLNKILQESSKDLSNLKGIMYFKQHLTKSGTNPNSGPSNSYPNAKANPNPNPCSSFKLPFSSTYTIKDPSSSSTHPIRDLPILFVTAGSSKKESSGQSRCLWCKTILPACLDFYSQNCLMGQNKTREEYHFIHSNDNNDNNTSDDNISDNFCKDAENNDNINDSDKNGDINIGPNLLIICEDGMLSCTVAMALLLSHFNSSIDFTPLNLNPTLNLNTSPNPSSDSNPSPSPSPNHSLKMISKHHSKEEIRTYLTLLQLYLPFADQLPRRLIKEINMYFSKDIKDV